MKGGENSLIPFSHNGRAVELNSDGGEGGGFDGLYESLDRESAMEMVVIPHGLPGREVFANLLKGVVACRWLIDNGQDRPRTASRLSSLVGWYRHNEQEGYLNDILFPPDDDEHYYFDDK